MEQKNCTAHSEICRRLSHDGKKGIEYDHGKA